MSVNISSVESYIKKYLETYKPYKGELAWNYEDGCTLIGVQRLFEATRDKYYYDFIYSYMDPRIGADGTIANFWYSDFNIDNINAGKVLFLLYHESGEKRFKSALDKVYYQLKIQPRTRAGNFWHKGRYPYQVWLDGLYMAQPFYAEYETEFNNKALYNDIFTQFNNVRKLMYDPVTSLYYHGYDETKSMNWADKKLGTSSNFWARSVGWYAMALIDTLEVLSEQIFEFHRELQRFYKELIKTLLLLQDRSCGMWYQVLTKEKEAGNYPETSATLMIAYSIMKGVRLGYAPGEYLKSGMSGFTGCIEKYLVQKNGNLILEGICIMAGLNGIAVKNSELGKADRNGSYEYYLSEAVGADDPKGVGPLMMAYSEVVRNKT